MRVCFYHTADAWSGRARFVRDAAQAMVARGYEVTCALARESAVARALRDEPLEVIEVRDPPGVWRAAWALARVIRQRFVEVVIAQDPREHLVAACAIRLADRGAVVRRLEPGTRLGVPEDSNAAGWLAASGYLFASEEDLRSSRPPARALEPGVAPPMIPPPALSDAPRPRGAPRVVVLTTARTRERSALALRAFAPFVQRARDVDVVLVAAPTSHDALRLHAAALGIGHAVQCVADGPSREAILATSSAVWVLGEADDAAFGLLDALRAGVPAIAVHDPVTARYFDETTGLTWSEREDANATAARIAGLLADESRRTRAAATARDRAAQFAPARFGDGLERTIAAARDRTRWRT